MALATPPGRGGLAVVRLSGPRAPAIAATLIDGGAALEPRRATLVRVVTRQRPTAPPVGRASVIDEAIVTFFAAPASYTGEDLVEFSLHGSPIIVSEVIGEAMAAGARLAGPGEFTLRAFLNGRLDLTRAEAVRDLVESTTPLQARMAFDQLQGSLAERIAEIEEGLFDLTARLEASGDFPDEGYHFITPEEILEGLRSGLARMEALLTDATRGRLLREGITVAIAGRPNVGKSTLFNRLVGVDRAIVTDVPGTTRDVLTEAAMLGGVRMTLVDTAGVRASRDPIEREGVARAEKAGAASDIVLVVLDAAAPLTEDDWRVLAATSGRTRLIVANKSDLAPAWRLSDIPASLLAQSEADSCQTQTLGVAISATSGAGIDILIRSINRSVGLGEQPEPALISNIRQIEILGHATEAMRRAESVVVENIGQTPEELILADLRIASDALQEVTGMRTSSERLDAIFSMFCIGK